MKRLHLAAILLLLWPSAKASAHQDAIKASGESQHPEVQAEEAQGLGNEILVTAQRRSERARDVPISISTFGADQLAAAGIVDTRSLTNIAPGVKIDRVGNFTIPVIRGVTTTITTPGADPNVATYLDGVYQASTLTNTFDLPDVERIEILRGPQGTLFGRNATGGAIQIITRSPSYTPEGMVSLAYGSFNTFTARGFVTGPIVEDVAAISVAAFYEKGDTFYNNIRTGGPELQGPESKLVRVKLQLDPSEAVRVTLAGRYSERQETVAVYGNALNGNTVARLLDPAAVIATRPFDVALNDEVAPQQVTAADISLRVDIDTGGGTISSLTSFVDARTTNVLDSDYAFTPNGLGVNFFVDVFDHYFAQETNYVSELDGPFNFSLGNFISIGESGWDPLGVQTPLFGVSIFGRQSVDSIAGFGEIYVDVTDRFSVIAGLRYSWEKRQLQSALAFGAVDLPMPDLASRGARTWDAFTPRVSLRYALNPDANVYATFSEGFKSGVFNTAALNADLADPETLQSYEIGFKGRVFDILSLDVAAFHYDYRNLQANIFTNVNGLPLSILTNAASARIRGLEADATLQVSGNFNLRAAFSVLDAQYEDFRSAAIASPCTNIPVAGPCSTIGVPNLTGNTTVAFDASGMRMVRTPEFTATLTANGGADVAGGRLDASATLYYSSSLNFTLDGRVRQQGYAMLDARLAWSPDNSGLTFAVFGRNLTDQAVIAGTFVTDSADGISFAPPRAVGLSAEYRF